MSDIAAAVGHISSGLFIVTTAEVLVSNVFESEAKPKVHIRKSGLDH